MCQSICQRSGLYGHFTSGPPLSGLLFLGTAPTFGPRFFFSVKGAEAIQQAQVTIRLYSLTPPLLFSLLFTLFSILQITIPSVQNVSYSSMGEGFEAFGATRC